MRKEEVEDTPNIVIGIFSMKTHPIEVLFDSSATHSFIFDGLIEILGLALVPKYSIICIGLSNKKAISCEELFMYYPI